MLETHSANVNPNIHLFITKIFIYNLGAGVTWGKKQKPNIPVADAADAPTACPFNLLLPRRQFPFFLFHLKTFSGTKEAWSETFSRLPGRPRGLMPLEQPAANKGQDSVTDIPVLLFLHRESLKLVWQGFLEDLQCWPQLPTAVVSWLICALFVYSLPYLSSLIPSPISLGITSQTNNLHQSPCLRICFQWSRSPDDPCLCGLTFWWQRETGSKQNK